MLKKINALEERVQRNDCPSDHYGSKLWQGAGVIVEYPSQEVEKNGELKLLQKPLDSSTDIHVISKHAAKVSSVMFALYKDIFASKLDHMSKYTFARRLAETANNHIIHNEDSEEVLLAIISEAKRIAREQNQVFVYGTLKRGYSNHAVMTDAGGVFRGETVIQDYSCINTPWFPYAVPEKGSFLEGEVYEVEDLEILDHLEGYPHLYNRQITQSRFGDVWIYFCEKDEINDYIKEYGCTKRWEN